MGIVSANVADLDIVTLATHGADRYLMWHHGLSHSLLAAVVAAPAIAGVARLIDKRAQFRSLVLLALLGTLSHVLMDVPTTWGTTVFAPFDWSRVALHWVYVVDLFFWVILTLPLWLGRLVPIPRARLNAVALLLLGAYVGLCGVLREAALQDVAAAAERQGIPAESVTAYPAPFLPLLWTGVADDGRLLHQGRVQLVGGEPTELRAVAFKNFDHPAVQAAAKTDLGALYLGWWATSPWAEVRCVGDLRYVVLGDLRFASPFAPGEGYALVFVVAVNPDTQEMTVQDRYWRTPWSSEPLPAADCQDKRTSTRI